MISQMDGASRPSRVPRCRAVPQATNPRKIGISSKMRQLVHCELQAKIRVIRFVRAFYRTRRCPVSSSFTRSLAGLWPGKGYDRLNQASAFSSSPKTRSASVLISKPNQRLRSDTTAKSISATNPGNPCTGLQNNPACSDLTVHQLLQLFQNFGSRCGHEILSILPINLASLARSATAPWVAG